MAQKSWTASEYLDLHQTKSTRDNYGIALKQFFNFLYPEEEIPQRGYINKVDELSKQYLSEDRDHDKDIAAYFNSMDQYAPKSRSLKFGAVKSWLEVNSIAINPAVLRSLNGKKAAEAISQEHIPTKDEIKRVLKHLPLHCRSLTLTMLSSGLRPGEALSLTFNSIDMESDPVKISLKATATKTGRQRWTYITPEAKVELEAWLAYREQFIQDTLSYVQQGPKTQRYLARIENLVYPFSYNAYMKNWKAALEKVNLLKIDEDTNRLTVRPHNLRKYFSTYGEWKDRDIPRFFQGHISALKAIYIRYDRVEDIVREAYEAAIPSLTIGSGFIDTKLVSNLEEKLGEYEKAKEETDKNVDFLLTQNRLLSLEAQQLKSQINDLDQQVLLLREGLKAFHSSWSKVTEQNMKFWSSQLVESQERMVKNFMVVLKNMGLDTNEIAEHVIELYPSFTDVAEHLKKSLKELKAITLEYA